MPTYEYACTNCAHRYEKREGFDAPAKQKCPRCGKVANRRMSLPAVVFKGAGFYKTDSRGGSSESAPSKEPATAAAESAPDGGATKGAAEAPAAKPDTKTKTQTTTETAAAG